MIDNLCTSCHLAPRREGAYMCNHCYAMGRRTLVFMIGTFSAVIIFFVIYAMTHLVDLAP